MIKKIGSIALLSVLTLAAARPAAAANKEHQQIMAELRMLQEQQAQLLQMIHTVTQTLQTITTRIEDQNTTTRKAFADQKLLIDNVAEAARILREKADDTNVRLSNVGQELQALRQAVSAIPQQSVGVPSATGDPAAAGDPTAVPQTSTGTSTVPVNVSPAQFYQRVMGDYAAGQYDLAVSGFEAFIRSFPTSPQADDAQLLIGNSYFNQGMFTEALAAYQKVVSDYPQGDQAPIALFKAGTTYENLKQDDLALKTYEEVIKRFPTDLEAPTMARQRLDALNRRRR